MGYGGGMTPDMFENLTHSENVSKKSEILYTSMRPFSVVHGVGGTRIFLIEAKNQRTVVGVTYGKWLDADQAHNLAHVICGFLNGEAA
jgi:hypothetical protein